MRSSFVIATPADPAPFTTTWQSSFLLSSYFQGIDDSGEDNDSCSVLVIMENQECSEVLSGVFQFRNSVELKYLLD